MSWEEEYVRDVHRARANRLDAEIAAAAAGAPPQPVYPECRLDTLDDSHLEGKVRPSLLMDPELILVCVACDEEVGHWPLYGELPTVSDLLDARTEHGAAVHPRGVE